jgi:hypothetical protein
VNYVIYSAVALTFFFVATGLAGIIRPFMPPRWQATLMAFFTALVWAPVRWWGGVSAGGDAGSVWGGGWVPLVATWLLGEVTNRPGYNAISIMLTALCAYALIRRWQSRRERQTETLH